MNSISFRPYLPKDAEDVADLFVDSIEGLASDYYDEDQIAAWASKADDIEKFGSKLSGMVTILAEFEGELLGFASLKDNNHTQSTSKVGTGFEASALGTQKNSSSISNIETKTMHIEMLYVSPNHARVGVGKALLEVMEILAKKRGAEFITVDASESASDFFSNMGYEAQIRNTVLCGDEWLVNTNMKKKMPNGEPKSNA